MTFVCANAEINRTGRIPHEYLRAVCGRQTIGWRILGEACQDRRASPGVLSQIAVDRNLGFNTRNTYLQLARTPRVYDTARVPGRVLRRQRARQHDYSQNVHTFTPAE